VVGTVDASHTILVIEDDTFIRELITTVLEDEGYAVICSTSPAAALLLAQVRRPDVILLDLSMPGLSGEEFIISYRLLPNATAPVVIISGQANLEVVARRAGADAYIAKPFDLTRLLDTVTAVLSASASHPGTAPDEQVCTTASHE
jgi:DNA-binding response OmpR family regulator